MSIKQENIIPVENLNDLHQCDHICLFIDNKHFIHALVDFTCETYKRMSVIYFYKFDLSKIVVEYNVLRGNYCMRPAKEDEESSEAQKTIKQGIHHHVVSVDNMKVYKLDYEGANIDTLFSGDSLEKALSFVGKSLYYDIDENINHDCNFVKYCKTNKIGSLTILSREGLIEQGFETIKGILVETNGALIIDIASSVTERFARPAVAAVFPVACDVISGGVGLGWEAISMTIDIRKKLQDQKSGKISKKTFKKWIVKRVSKGAWSSSLSIGGGILGQMIIPIPIVGGVVGAVAGATVGTAIGVAKSFVIGKIIDTMEEREKERAAQRLKELNSGVLHHLLVKVDKNLLKDNRFDYLKQTDANNNDLKSCQLNLAEFDIYIQGDKNDTSDDFNIISLDSLVGDDGYLTGSDDDDDDDDDENYDDDDDDDDK